MTRNLMEELLNDAILQETEKINSKGETGKMVRELYRKWNMTRIHEYMKQRNPI